MAHPLPLDVETLLAQEPSVRALARHLLREEADDLVQETWLRALTRGGFSIREPRRWLRRIARNVASNLGRTAVRRSQRERAAAVREAVPSSLELLEREERRRALVLAVDELSPPLRAVILLRYFEGRPPRAIAVDLRIPVTLVWDRLERARAQLRARLDREHGGDRRAWLLPLVAPRPAASAGTLATLWTGVLLMTVKAKTAVVAAFMLLTACTLWWITGNPLPVPELGPETPLQGEARARRADDHSTASKPAAAATREAVASVPAASPLATLVVHAFHADGTPASGVTLVTFRSGEDQWIGPRRERTDALGFARFLDMTPGPVVVRNELGAGIGARLQAGRVTELEFRLPRFMDLSGVVVDQDGAPVAGAEVWYVSPANSDQEAGHVATTDVDGRFLVRSCFMITLIGARAAGRAPSRMQFLMGREGGRHEVRIVLPGAGGDVEGTVVGPDGRPVADALLWIGRGRVVGVPTTSDGVEALPAQARTDTDGRFRAAGLPAGEHPVVARARGFAPWQGTCRVVVGTVAALALTLAPGMRVTGKVTDADIAVADAELTVGEDTELAYYRTRSRPDGTFQLEGLPAGELRLLAVHNAHGKATVTLRGVSGETLSCVVPLSHGIVLRGRVLSEAGEPLPGRSVDAWGPAAPGQSRWFKSARSDAQGRFAIDNCPEGRLLRLTTETAREVRVVGRRVDPRAGELVVRIPIDPPPSARIVGTFLLADGTPAKDLTVISPGAGVTATDKTGHVEIGPVAPGAVRVEVDIAAFPLFRRARELAANETWDLGTVRLSKGGTVRLQPGGATTGASFSLHEAAGTWMATIDPVSRRSRLLEPGRYHLRVAGPGTAAQVLPVEIRDSEETVVEVACQAGVVQHFELATSGGWPAVSQVSVEIAGSGGPLQSGFATIDDDDQCAWECRLLPGTYTVTATAGGRSGSARFTVVEGENPPVRVELR